MKYLVEARDSSGALDFAQENIARVRHPYLFSKSTFTIDELCHYASYGQGRDTPIGPYELSTWLAEQGLACRPKTW
jgi:hypothetical protein